MSLHNNDKGKARSEDDHVIDLATRDVWQGKLPVRLFAADRRQHMHVIGKTGTGKSTLLRNLILQDIEAGAGVGLIDPHGDLATDILDHIPPWRSHEVVYFNPADLEYPTSFNLLSPVPLSERHRVASGIVGAFKNIWRESWGPRLEYLLYASIAALLECRNVSLLGVQRLLTDLPYRRWVINQIDDVVLKTFWSVEFEQYDRRLLAEFLAPIQNKLGQFLLAAPVRNIVGQVRNRIETRYIMDKSRIFIANLSKGFLGADKANLLGAALVSQFELAALSRADIPESNRRDFFLFIDEFHNFATDSFATILSESRKYRLNLTLSHQYISQLRSEVEDAIFGNVGSLVSFRVGQTDAEKLERELGRSYSAEHLTGLGNFEVCVRLLKGGFQQQTFLAQTLPPSTKQYGLRDDIISRSRARYGTSRLHVESKIERWLNENRRGVQQ